MTEWKTTVHILASSQSSIAEQQKIVLADGSLCSRQQPPYVGVEEEEEGGGEWGVGGSVAEPPLFWAAPAPALGGQGPGADSGSGSDLLGSAPAPGKKRRLHTLNFFILSS